MKKPNRGRLNFDREIIRVLKQAELGGVAGGETDGTSYILTVRALNQPPTQGH